MAWVAQNIDRPALDALQRMTMKRCFCTACGFIFYRTRLTPHICPDCGSDELMEVAA